MQTPKTNWRIHKETSWFSSRKHNISSQIIKNYQRKQDYKEHISYKKHKNADSSSWYSSNSIELERNSNVSDWDNEIEKLEKNVKISRKILQENTKIIYLFVINLFFQRKCSKIYFKMRARNLAADKNRKNYWHFEKI